MGNTRESKVSIRLDVILAPALKAFADPKYEQGQEFASWLLKYSNGFLNSLKIPALFSLSVKPGADDQRLIGSPFRIFLGDRRCRITLPVAVAESVRASELAVQIANVIYRNLELVFDNALSQ